MGNTILLLLVEDNPLIAELMKAALADRGYDVIWSGGGMEALGMLDDRVAEIAGLITDIRLGEGPSGWKVAHHGRELRPELPVVYMTGDSAGDWTARGVPNSVLLQKPFAPAQLVTAISTLLINVDSRPGSTA
ncbi:MULTISPECIES: response regulator [unclassified Sphingomonas]|uniref:response regulator n=1 Tax=Sphingomonas TaxID=13687 RepID=UPI000958FBA1|nr:MULTISPECIES: response regulator [unclassified Sphingomonas]MBN8812369.1 response regulator [Sphingomonas sp.]OJY48059.1 MAG: response regulator [Sphingomonas sp. 67-41]